MHKVKLLDLSLLALIVITCTNQNDVNLSSVAEINGEVTLIRNRESKKLEPNTTLKKQDAVIVSEKSNIKLVLFDGSEMFINGGGHLNFINLEQKKDKTLKLEMAIDNGEVFLTKKKNDSVTYLISTGSVNFKVSSGDVLVKLTKDKKLLSLSVFNDSISVSTTGKSVLVPSCTRQEITRDNIGQLEPINESEIVELKRWIPASVIKTAMQKSECIGQAPVSVQLPPEWAKTPKEMCAVNGSFIDTVVAIDPEGKKVTYALTNAPAGMVIDKFTGIIRYNPKITGIQKVTINAIDSDSMVSRIDYELNITEGLGVIIAAPKVAVVNRTFPISATALNSAKSKDEYLYRFDFDDDGKIDFPSSGEFGRDRVCTYSFAKEGDYKIKVEIKNRAGEIASAKKIIAIKTKPKAVLHISPTLGKAGTEFLLDATESLNSNGTTDSLLVRFDIDGDGKWDLPPANRLFREKKLVWTWTNSGKINVILEIMDKNGLTDTAHTEVTVSKDVVIDSISAPDTVHIGTPVKITCTVSEPQYPIVKYEWSLDNDTVFEEQSTEKFIKKAFSKEGEWAVICRITDEKGQTALQQKSIIIVNNKPVISAGGPYNIRIGERVTLKGKAMDADSKIVSYGWDLNGDGALDSISKSNISVTYAFNRSGKKVVYFVIATDDGNQWKDSAIVNVVNKKPIAIAGEDIVSKPGKKVKLNGIGEDEDKNIMKYEWDFDGDGKFDWASEKNGAVIHEFKSYTNAIFKVTDSDSQFNTDTVKIIICPDGMNTMEKGKYCIDTYEYPNRKGRTPSVNVSFEEAQKACLDQGKHLCTVKEWEAACQSEDDKLTYPYGKKFEIDQCNTMGNAYVINKLAPSGEFSKCRGSAGVFDMSGNTAEWVSDGKQNTFVYGGSWQNGKDESKCNSKVSLQKGRKYFYVGFRCCK